MNNCLFLNSLKLIIFVKLHTNTLLKPIDCLKLYSSGRMMGSVTVANTCLSANSSQKILVPPEAVKGIKKLDKSIFDKKINVPAIFINSNDSFSSILDILKKYHLKVMGVRNLLHLGPNDDLRALGSKAVLLNPDVVVDFNSINETDRISLEKLNIKDRDFHLIERTLSFDNWGILEIIKAVLPDNINFSGYSIIGHIAHLNLRPELLDFKYVLGEIIMNKIKRVRTVVNKVNIIENTFRSFQMELICGENNMRTKLRENGCTYELDFSEVYWNSRLSTEHERITNLLGNNDVLYDVFAGIGPFVIPAAKKGCTVIANDLNPDAYKWLLHNLRLNKIFKGVTCYNCDAKYFIEVHLRKHLLTVKDCKKTNPFKVHITMNLPATAVGFLNDFRSMFTEDEINFLPNDIICHLYCFIKADNLDKLEDKEVHNLARELVETHLRKRFNDKNLVEIVFVRKVAPCKAMLRVSFLFEPDFLTRKSTKRNYDDANVIDTL